jgi:hypothetical protein
VSLAGRRTDPVVSNAINTATNTNTNTTTTTSRSGSSGGGGGSVLCVAWRALAAGGCARSCCSCCLLCQCLQEQSWKLACHFAADTATATTSSGVCLQWLLL